MKIQKGFTLLEVAVVLAIISVFAAFAVPSIIDEINISRAKLASTNVIQITKSARQYKQDTGNWPGSPSCANAYNVLTTGASPYLSGVPSTNPFNAGWVTTCSANAFNVSQNAVSGYETMVAASAPGSAVTNPVAFTITTSVNIDASSSALGNILSRVNTGDTEANTMRTTLRGGTNDITGASTVSSTSLSTTGSISSGGNISATGDFTAANITATGTARGATVSATGNMSIAQDLAVGSTLTSNDARVVTETYAGGWFRSNGAKGWYSEKWGGGWYMSDSTWIRAFNDKSIYTGGEYKSLDQVSWTRTKAGEFVDLLNVNSRNAACASNGLVSREWDGGILYCKSGLWRSTAEVGDYVFSGTFVGSVSRPPGNYASIVVASGGYCGNQTVNLQGIVNGVQVTYFNNNATGDSRRAAITFMVPAHQGWQVVSDPNGCAAGTFTAWQFDL